MVNRKFEMIMSFFEVPLSHSCPPKLLSVKCSKSATVMVRIKLYGLSKFQTFLPQLLRIVNLVG